MYYQKIYRCRKTVWVEKYQRRVYAKGEKRSERKAPTPEKKKKENDLQAKRLLARKLEANFGEDDYFTTLTYKGDAPNQEEAKRRLDKFIRGMREDYRKLGSELKYIVVTEWQGKRIHHHIVMNGLPETPKLLKKNWPHGRPDMKLLDESGDYEALAEYLIKETEKTFRDPDSTRKQRYTCSRNLLNPEPERKKIKAKSFRQTPKTPKGYKIVEGTLVAGVSEVSGYLYQYYKLIKIDSMEDTDGDKILSGDNKKKKSPERRRRKDAGTDTDR